MRAAILATLVVAAPFALAQDAGAPDLVAEEVVPTDWLMVAGDPMEFLGDVARVGGDAVDLDVEFLIDGVSIGGMRLYAMPQGTTRVISPTWNATPGLHYVTLVVDAADEVDEPVESNNARRRQLVVRPGIADLDVAIDVVGQRPARVENGALVPAEADVRVTLCNVGTARADRPYVWVRADAQPFGVRQDVADVSAAPLLAGACAAYDRVWRPDGAIGRVRLDAEAVLIDDEERGPGANTAEAETAFVVDAPFGVLLYGLP